jgi:hypothetical protein
VGRKSENVGSPRDLPVAIVAHACAGRIRLSFPDRKDQRSFFEEVCDATLRLPGVSEVEGRPGTGSLIITHDGATEALLQAAQSDRAFAVEKTGDESAHAGDTLDWQALLARVTKDTSSPSGGIRSAAIIALLVMVVLQATRGQIMPPATTALWYALSLLLGKEMSSGEPSGDGGP